MDQLFFRSLIFVCNCLKKVELHLQHGIRCVYLTLNCMIDWHFIVERRNKHNYSI